MKRIFAFALFIAVLLSLFACGNNEDIYASLCSQLDETSMSGTEYSQSEIDQLESRFAKMNLEGGFKRVNHFRSKTEYAYVIEFENSADATTFSERIGT